MSHSGWSAARSSASAEEAELVALVAKRDRQAFQKLYFAYHRRMHRFLMRMLHRPELAEEVINDTMFVVWNKAAEFRGDSQVSTWILGIAYRHALKALKKLQSTAALELAAMNAQDSSGADPRSRRAESEELIERALHALPPPQRAVIELAYFMGHSCEEIAAVADCPVNTVKTRLFHARERLRVLLPALAGSNGQDLLSDVSGSA